MLHPGLAEHPFLPAHPKRRCRRRVQLLMASLCAMLVLAAVTLWSIRGTPIVNLVTDSQIRSSGVYADWDKGEIILLVRHAERCDRSNNPCLDEPSGITSAGSEAAAQVGAGISRLGLEHTDVLSSTSTRTQQTAHFMFGKLAPGEAWVEQCNKGFAAHALAHKKPDRNLVLVTHSGCIDQLERQLGVPGGERSSGYAEALFVSVGSNGKPRILGKMSAPQWRKLLATVDQ
ncbi:histidine phosphatase family protein [Pseudomonas sp. SDI]|nr:histidine phosphatase family protein [Pseudomonas sp. SDI]PWB34427.1 histidine phosphatase family protein [Pseudomonas sp. SDI]